MSAKRTNGRRRPPVSREKMERALDLVRRGYTLRAVAAEFGYAGAETVRQWRRYPWFDAAIDAAKAEGLAARKASRTATSNAAPPDDDRYVWIPVPPVHADDDRAMFWPCRDARGAELLAAFFAGTMGVRDMPSRRAFAREVESAFVDPDDNAAADDDVAEPTPAADESPRATRVHLSIAQRNEALRIHRARMTAWMYGGGR